MTTPILTYHPSSWNCSTNKFAIRFRTEEVDGLTAVSTAILSDLEETTASAMEKKLKRYVSGLPQYEDNEWTTSETINRSFALLLKRYQVDAFPITQERYKDADKQRYTTKAASKLFEELEFISINGGDTTTFTNVVEKARRLTVYSFQTAKTIDIEARILATKALRLPQSLK